MAHPLQAPGVSSAGYRVDEAGAEHRALRAEQMLGIVSHDLRNPLLAIRMAAGILARRAQEPRTTQLLAQIIQSTERAERLAADLQDFCQVQAGRGLAILPVPGDFQQAVASCLDELRLSFADVTLRHVRLGEGRVAFDHDRLCQLIGNLVGNAVAYGHPGAPVTVTAHIGVASASVSVHNLGMPITHAHISQLFEPRVRGYSQNVALRSVGLGLFIVRQIARAHHGEVTVHSSWRAGTTFSVVFPRNCS